jgi:hypothetical protein
MKTIQFFIITLLYLIQSNIVLSNDKIDNETDICAINAKVLDRFGARGGIDSSDLLNVSFGDDSLLNSRGRGLVYVKVVDRTIFAQTAPLLLSVWELERVATTLDLLQMALDDDNSDTLPWTRSNPLELVISTGDHVSSEHLLLKSTACVHNNNNDSQQSLAQCSPCAARSSCLVFVPTISRENKEFLQQNQLLMPGKKNARQNLLILKNVASHKLSRAVTTRLYICNRWHSKQ